ncbi:MAG TPA: alpha-glucan family phosphorylase [Candidatus Acidoferrales bacterium]|nr:alpha-glucan family phosphorylase [Candidatus Acidoferrales bacterium]
MQTIGHPLRAAYFSMEIALDPAIPTYSGGLGILAGDTLRSAADLGLPVAGVTLLYRQGYFEQRLDTHGNQTESPSQWDPTMTLELKEPLASIQIEGRTVRVRAWQYKVQGFGGHVVPVYLLDTSIPENSEFDRTLTDRLYAGDPRYRLCQEAVLGIGGIALLRRLGHDHILTYHMNEGHAALLTLALLEEQLAARGTAGATQEDFDLLRSKCVFTTHTPVPAGHDRFPKDMVHSVLGAQRVSLLEKLECFTDNALNMTHVALETSRYVNGVAMKHGAVSRGMFPEYSIRAITNGVHAGTWTSPAFQDLYDRNIPEWRRDNLYLRYAIGIPLQEIRQAHSRAKHELTETIFRLTGVQLDETVMTIGFARRAAAYKRMDFVFSNLERLKWIARHVGPFQIVYAGKAHPHDEPAKALIQRVFKAMAALRGSIRVVYLQNYEMRLARLLTSGVDLWLNTPQRPQEASGTSGMKAALNGVPSLSVLDGWWHEGHVEGATGWAIGHSELLDSAGEEIASLYDKLEHAILPLYYGQKDAYVEVMRSTIALNGSFFNTQRMVAQYMMNAYFHEKDGLFDGQPIIESTKT